MSLSRANAVAYLVGAYGTGTNALLQAADVGLTDVTGGLKEPIDDALLALDVPYSDVGSASVVDVDVPRALALMRYTTLRRILAGLNAKTHMDVQVGDIKLSGNQLIAKVEKLLALAADEAAVLGIVVADSSGGWGSGSISLDFLEPLPRVQDL